MNYHITLMFDGTGYHGWQRQENALSVQQKTEEAVFGLFGEKTGVTGCSRTDAGVHAQNFHANFRTEKILPANTVVSGLNFYLPDDISVIACEPAAADFNARFSCVSKEYRYLFYDTPYCNPFYAHRAVHSKHKLDETLMDRAAKAYVGTHDFSAFCAAGAAVRSNVRTVKKAGVFRDGDKVVFYVEADGFLYNMVRIMAGTLLYIDEGKIPADATADIISSGDRLLAGKTMPPEGLYLYRVNY